jgi:hypothetical protein
VVKHSLHRIICIQFLILKDGVFQRSSVLLSPLSMVSETVTWCKYKKLLMRSKIETTYSSFRNQLDLHTLATSFPENISYMCEL